MLKFVILVAALLLLATSFVLGPDVVRAMKGNAERQPVKRFGIAVALLIAVGTLGLYLKLGEPDAIRMAAIEPPPGPAHPMTGGGNASGPALSLEQAAKHLEQRLRDTPDDPAGWTLLAQTYRRIGMDEAAAHAEKLAEKYRGDGGAVSGTPVVATADANTSAIASLRRRVAAKPDDLQAWISLGRAQMHDGDYPGAVASFESALDINMLDAGLLADAADARAAVNNRRFDEASDRLIADALAVDPHHPKALWLAGTSAMHRGDLDLAAQHWGTLLDLLPPESADATAVRQNIAALGDAGESAVPAMPATAPVIVGEVSIGTGIATAYPPEATVFIFARAVDGPRMPLAIVRKTVADLPTQFRFDESTAMTPGMTLADYPEIIVGARVSRTGNAMPEAGDAQGFSGPFPSADPGRVSVVIDSPVL